MNRRSIFKRLLGAVGLTVTPAVLQPLTSAAVKENPLFSGGPAQWDGVRLCLVKDPTTGRFKMYSYTPNERGGLALSEVSPSPSLPVSKS